MASSPKEDETQPGLRPEIEDFDRPLQIITIDETKESKFSLNVENLNKIVAEIEKINTKKVVILSVVGAFRTGKSFLLDFLLRYLRYSEKNGDPPRMTDDQTMPEWVKQGGALTEGRSESKVPGFMWRSGSERETLGIWMYGKPFAKKLPGSSELVPVVLMDTQGMFDMKTSEEITAAIFGLSTLISSVQVYNISKQIQEDKLQQLHYFTEFSRVALKEFDKAQAREAKVQKETKGSEEKKLHPFQTLQFLVRDWEHFDDNDGVAKRVEEMDAVLEKAMSTQFNDRGTRQQIKDSFQQLKCFLFPHPGLKIPAKNYDGQLEVIEKSFFQLLDEYVHQLFGEMLVIKKINEREVGAQALAQFMKAYANVFKEGRLPVPMTLVEAISFTTNLCAKDEALTLYRATMDKETGSSGLPEAEFEKKHVEARTKAIEWFDGKATFGSDEDINKTKSELETQCENEGVKYKELNKYKIQRGIERYVIPLLAAIVAYVLDWATDWLCDSWSETCQKISRFTALFYYCVTLFLGYAFWQIYNNQGSASVGVSAMHLGQATIQKAEEIRKQVQKTLSPTKGATEEKSVSKHTPKSPTTKKND